MEGCRVSVIVPVHNAAQYLPQTMGNLFFQTLFDRTPPGQMEIILVNDASTDESPAMLQGLKEQYPDRMRLIELPENRGPGGARNAGMDAARGEYIGFMDADDYVDPSMYEKLYEKAVSERGPVDAAGFDVVDSVMIDEVRQTRMLYTPPECRGALDGPKRARMISACGYVFTRIYRRAFLEAHRIRFPALYFGEDEVFLAEVYAYAANAEAIPDALYFYKANERSARSRGQTLGMFDDTRQMLEMIGERLSKVPDYETFYQGFEADCMWQFATNLVLLGQHRNRKELTEKRMRALLSDMQRTYRRLVHGRIDDNPYIGRLITDEQKALLKDAFESGRRV